MNSELENLMAINQEDFSALEQVNTVPMCVIQFSQWESIISVLKNNSEMLTALHEEQERLATNEQMRGYIYKTQRICQESQDEITERMEDLSSLVGSMSEWNSTAMKDQMDSILEQYKQLEQRLFRRMIWWAISLMAVLGLVTIFLK